MKHVRGCNCFSCDTLQLWPRTNKRRTLGEYAVVFLAPWPFLLVTLLIERMK